VALPLVIALALLYSYAVIRFGPLVLRPQEFVSRVILKGNKRKAERIATS
jgi:hypothetical protein